MLLETITGNLRDAYQQLQPGTMLHVDQLMNERRTHADGQVRQELCNQWFYTADGEVYFLDGAGKTPTLAITREAHNPVLQHIDDAFEQLTQNHNYRLSQTDAGKAVSALDTVLIALPKLRLYKHDSEFSYLVIGTTPRKYGKLNEEERKFAERVYGQEDDFVQNMKMLDKAKIDETRIFVLNPDYVLKQAAEGAVGRASWLSLFYYNSNFNAIDRYIYNRNSVRGVRKKTDNDQFSTQKSDNSSDFLRREFIAEGDAPKNQGPYRTAAPNVFKGYYDAILADQERAVKAMDDKTAAGLLEMVSNYYKTR